MGRTKSRKTNLKRSRHGFATLVIRLSYLGIVIFALTFFAIGQQESPNNEEVERAQEIIKASRIKVFQGTQGSAVRTLFYSATGKGYSKTEAVIKGRSSIQRQSNELLETKVEVDFSGKIRTRFKTISSSDGIKGPVKVESVSVVNGDRHSSDIKGTLAGKKIDIGASQPLQRKILKQVGMEGDEKNTFPEIRGKDLFLLGAREFYPFLLQSAGADEWKFKYIGKAEAEGITADVLEFIPDPNAEISNLAKKQNPKSTTRYFFDSKTKLLLMTTVDTESDLVKIKTSMYYANHKMISGILIPTKIKIEQETIMKKQMKILGMTITSNKSHKITDLTVEGFEINLEFPPDIFEIKKK